MQRFYKLFFFVVTILFASLLFAETSFANEHDTLPKSPIEGMTSKSRVDIQSLDYLMNGQCFINAVGNKLSISGTTKAYQPVDTITVSLYLQRWDAANGVWKDEVNMGNYSNYQSSLVSGGKSVIVPSGYYYRTRGYHWINEGGKIEQVYSYSSYIYVK